MEIIFKNSELQQFAKLTIPKIEYNKDLKWVSIDKIEVDIFYSIFSIKLLIDTQDNDFDYFLKSIEKLYEGVIKRAHFNHLDNYLKIEVCRDHPTRQIYLSNDDCYFIVFKVHDNMGDGDFQLVQVIDRNNIADLINQFTTLKEEVAKHYENKH